VISGAFTDREASDLALLIRAGALPVPVEVVEQRTVGPTLGEAAIRASTQAAVLGAALTMLYMIAYYRLLGGLAAVALVCYGLLSFAVLLALRATLTLPGVAGFVLAIGMAVDANVLVFERMREEHRAGAGLVARGPNFGVDRGPSPRSRSPRPGSRSSPRSPSWPPAGGRHAEPASPPWDASAPARRWWHAGSSPS
jgi:hypothetical protein